jgi:EAL domain-containing protein (putative c-di-GMP-specific phosphodiesterase class I)
MYRAKVGGRGKFHLFTSDIKDKVREAVLLEFDLRQGIGRGELVLHYQPQMDLLTGRVAGVEALVRWRHPQRGLLPPADFLGMAEESGLIAPMTRWVLRETCAQAARWQRMGLRRRIAVNISSVLFRKEDVRRLVTSVLAETGLDPALLEIEITETALMENPEAAANELRELQDLGVRFSIDDFGTGYSSLSRLKLLPVNRLKIDKSFVGSLTTDRSDIAIVRAIISIGRSLNLDIIAEGVETADQVRLLRAEGCQEIQGFYVAPPLPAGELELFLRERETGPDERLPSRRGALAHGS